MMKMSKILININELYEIEEYKKIGISNFLFAIPEYSIGYQTIRLDKIPDDAYIFINRVFDCALVDSLKQIKDKLLRFKGIIYEDIAVFNIFKDTNLELIWYQNHFQTNYESINFWLQNGCNSCVISDEITEPEIINIIDKTTKPLVLSILAKNQIMYSRRTLLTNFNKYNDLDNYNDMLLKENNTNNSFLARENEYGTIIYNNAYFNYVPLMKRINDDKIKFYLIMNLDLTPEFIQEVLNGKEFGNDGFLNKKTVYRMSEYDDR